MWWIRPEFNQGMYMLPLKIKNGFSQDQDRIQLCNIRGRHYCMMVNTGVKMSGSERGLRYLRPPVRQMISPRSVVTGDQQGRTPHPPSLLAPRPGWWNSWLPAAAIGHWTPVNGHLMPHTFNWSDGDGLSVSVILLWNSKLSSEMKYQFLKTLHCNAIPPYRTPNLPSMVRVAPARSQRWIWAHA